MHWQLKAIPFALAGTLLVVTGCGQGTYDARMAAAPAMIKKRSEEGDGKLLTKEFFSITDTPGAKQGVKFKLPTAFTGSVDSLGANDPGAKVSQADIPGFLYSIRTKVADDTGKQIAAYCYLYSVKKAEKPRADLEELIKQALGQLQNTAAWQPVTKAGRPPGGMISITGNFDFPVDGVNQNLPGQLVIHSFEADQNTVFVGWMYENKSAQKSNLAGAVSKAMDTAALDTAEAAPVPAPAPMPAPNP
jgi:hypothetical protein